MSSQTPLTLDTGGPVPSNGAGDDRRLPIVGEATQTTFGNRMLTNALALIVGIVYGIVGTVAHVNVIEVSGIRLPVGLVLAVAGAAALFLAFRLMFETRMPVLFVAIGVVGMIALFSVTSSGGTVLIPAGVVGLIWPLATVLVATIVVGWPTARRIAELRALGRGESLPPRAD